MKKCLALMCFFVLMFSEVFSQEEQHSGGGWIVGPGVSYQYQSNSMLKVSFWGLTDVGFSNYLKVDANADFVWKNNKTYVIPEIGVTYYLNTVAIWPYLRAELTPYTVSPKLGIGLFNLIDLGLGYGWSFQDRKGLGKIGGVNVSLGLSLPLNFFF